MRFLLDEMFSPAAAALLRDGFGHEAVHVGDVGLRSVDDAVVATFARSERRAVVTENVSDYAPEADVVLVCVLKRKLPSGGVSSPCARRTARPLGPRAPPAVRGTALANLSN